MPVLVLVNASVHNEFEMPNFTHSKHMTGASQFKNGSRAPDRAPFDSNLSSQG